MSDSLQPCGLQHSRLSLSFSISQSLLKFLSIESVILSNYPILCWPLLFLISIFSWFHLITKVTSGKCMLLGSVSSQQRFGVMDIKALRASLGSWTNRVIALRQISVTALFYLENDRRIHPPGMRACRPKDVKSAPARRRERKRESARTWRGRERERERARTHAGEKRESERALWLLLLYVFSSLWACPMQTGPARSAVCSTWSPHSGPWTFLCFIFAGFFLPCLLATAILDSCFLSNYLTDPNLAEVYLTTRSF